MASLDEEFDALPTTLRVPGQSSNLDAEFDALPNPASQEPKTSLIDSVLHAGADFMGLGPRLVSAKKALNSTFNSTDLGKLKEVYSHPIDSAKEFGRIYDESLPKYQAEFSKAANDHPIASFATSLAMGRGVNPKNMKQALAIGVGSGVAGTNADLGKAATGDTEELKKVGASAGLGAGLTYLGRKAPILTGAGSAIAGLFGDKLGLDDAAKTQLLLGGGLSAGMGLAGRAKARLTQSRDNAVDEALVKPREQLDTLRNKAEIAQERRQSAVAKKAEDIQAALDAPIEEANTRYQEARKRILQKLQAQDQLKDLDIQEQVVNRKAYDQRAGETNAQYRERLKGLEEQFKAKQGVAKDQEKIQAALQALAEEEGALPNRVSAKRASEFGAVGGRIKSYKDLTGQDLPEELQPLQQKITDTFKSRTPEVIGKDPDVAAAEFEALERARLGRERQQLEAKLGRINEPTEVIRRQPTLDPEFKTSAFNLAKELGLNPGELEGFNPRASLPLADVPEPPKVDLNAEKMTKIARKRAQLEKLAGADTAVLAKKRIVPNREKLEAYKLARDLGLDPGHFDEFDPTGRLPLMKSDKVVVSPDAFAPGAEISGDQKIARLMRLEDKARSKYEGLKGQLETDPQGFVLNQGKKTVKDAAVNNFLSGGEGLIKGSVPFAIAKKAYNDPAARAFLMDKFQNAIKADTALAQRYAGYLSGVSEPVAVTRALFALENDPELQRAAAQAGLQ